MIPSDRRWNPPTTRRPIRSIYAGAGVPASRAQPSPRRSAALAASTTTAIATAAPAELAAEQPPAAPAPTPAALAADKAAADKQVWDGLKPGIYQAIFVAWLFSALHWKEVEDGEMATYLVGLIFAVLAARTALLFPRRMPLLLAAYLPYNREFALKIPGVPAGNMTTAILLLLLVGYVASRRQRRDRLRFGFFEYLVLAYLTWGFLSTVNAQLFLHSLKPLKLLMAFRAWAGPMLIFFLIRALIRSREDVKALFVVILVTTSLIALVCVKEGMERRSGSIEKSRIKGPMLQANTMGAYLAYYGVPMFCVLIRYRFRDWRLRGATAFGLLLVAKAITHCFSRGAYLAFGGGCFLVYLLRNPVALAVSIGVYAGAASVFPDQLIPSSVVKRMGHSQSGHSNEMEGAEAQLDSSALTRLAIWRAARRMIPDYPVFGVGVSQWPRYLPRYDDTRDIIAAQEAGQRIPTDAHNAYLLTAGELGIPAAILMIVILLRSFFTGLRLYFRSSHPLDRTIALSLHGSTFAMIFSCLFGSRFTDECLVGYWWILLAMATWIEATSAAERKASRSPRTLRAPVRAVPAA